MKYRKIVLKINKNFKENTDCRVCLSKLLHGKLEKNRLKIDSKIYETFKTACFICSEKAASERFQINYQPQHLELIKLTNVFLLIIWALFLQNCNDLHTDIAILLSMVKTLLFTLNMIKSLTSCSNFNWMVNLIVFLPQQVQQTFKRSQLISMQ